MKYLKLFEDVITDYIKKKEKLKTKLDIMDEHLFEYIDQYILTNKDKWGKWGIEYFKKTINIKKDYNLIITYQYYHSEYDYDNTSIIVFKKDDYDDFLKFIEDSDLYKSTKKYNL